MAYIYKIYNDINNKIYVGKTLSSIEKRFQVHIQDSKKEYCKNRPLYKAFNKYGIEHFHIELLEECSEKEVNQKEKNWIEKLGSFKYGYNATKGGDGKHYADYDLIFSLWKEGKNNFQIQQILGYDSHTIKVALENNNISKEERIKRGQESCYHNIAMLDKNTLEIVKVFPSVMAACKFLNKQHSGYIAAVCKGKRQTAYGYSWKYIE